MEIRMLETFLKVASTGNFSKAAEALGYSQSAVTVQMQKLEGELGTSLFERIGKRAYLTKKGEEFIPYAEDVMKSYMSAVSFDKKDGILRGRLRIGGVESICTALLPKLLIEFYKICPHVEVVIKSGITEDLISMAESNDLDLIFTLDDKIFSPSLTCVLDKKEDVVIVTSPQFCQRDFISSSCLAREPFILTERNAPYREEFEKRLSVNDLAVRPILETGNTETIINLLKKGVGMSFLPIFTVEDDLKDNKLKIIESDLPKVEMDMQLFYHKNKYVTGEMEIFNNLVKDFLK